MQILFLAPQPFFQERGTPIAVRLMVDTLARMGHKIHLLVYHEGENISAPNVCIHRIPSLPGLKNIRPGFSLKKLICDTLMFFKSVKLVTKYKFDLIHAVEESVFLALILKVLWQIPFVYDMDSCLSIQITDKFPLLRRLKAVMEGFERLAVKGSIGTVAVCRSLEDFARRFAPDKLVRTIEDISLLNKTNNGDETLREVFNSHGPIVMYVGNLERYQGIDLLLDSFFLVKKRGSSANLVIIGGNEEDIRHYRERAERLGLEDSVFFCGPRPVSLLAHYLKQADILVSPRIKGNNTPMKVYSFLDSGRPLLATRLPTHTQALDDEIACLVDPTPENMASGIMKLLEDENLRKRLRNNALEIVSEEYSLASFQRKTCEFYGQVARKLGEK